jgi:hypothetical protein
MDGGAQSDYNITYCKRRIIINVVVGLALVQNNKYHYLIGSVYPDLLDITNVNIASLYQHLLRERLKDRKKLKSLFDCRLISFNFIKVCYLFNENSI